MGGYKILFVVVSGPEEFEKARQALRIARNIARKKFAEDVRILFVGPGVRLLAPSNSYYKLVDDYLAELNDLHVYVAVCAGNLKAYNLEEKINKRLVIEDDATAVISEAASKGYTILTF